MMNHTALSSEIRATPESPDFSAIGVLAENRFRMSGYLATPRYLVHRDQRLGDSSWLPSVVLPQAGRAGNRRPRRRRAICGEQNRGDGIGAKAPKSVIDKPSTFRLQRRRREEPS